MNDKVVTLPLLMEPYVYVERQTNTILLNTNIGLKVSELSSLFPSERYLSSHTLAAAARFCGAGDRTWR